MNRLLVVSLILFVVAAFSCAAFTPAVQESVPKWTPTTKTTILRSNGCMVPLQMSENTKSNEYLQKLRSENPEMSAEPKMNPNRPELPIIPGDYDWDSKYMGDEDWVTGNEVPGMMPLNEIELAQQVTSLGGLEEKWRKERILREYEESKNVGFVANAELLNGRYAMFFLVTGLLTEYWTGISLPGQVEEMLRISGVIGFDG